jgi:mono/diheme cytochrome c family protein
MQATALSLAGAGLLGAVFSIYIFLKQGRKAALGIAFAAALLVLLTAPALLDSGPATAQAAQTNALASYSGQQLFMAKGCVVCHEHDRGRQGYEGVQSNIGPNLSERKLPAEYLRVWLANPPSVKPRTLMPDLDLTDGEIEALVAFLNSD